MDLSRQNFLVLGVSKSGFSAGNLILDRGGKCKIFEEKRTDKIKEKIDKLISLGAVDVSDKSIEDALFMVDVVVLSPGVPINHKLCILAKEKGIRIVSEFEFGFEILNPITVAVTGTNGKTTTVSLIEHVLASSNRKVVSVGNVGVPVTSKINDIVGMEVCVSEVSSFQLESISRFAPHIACVLNISPDHLERHYNMDNYVFLKRRLISKMLQSEYAVLNFDDEIVKEFAKSTLARKIFVSVKEQVDGAYLKNGKLYFMNDFIMDINDIPLTGIHNVYNVLFTIAVCSLLGAKSKEIKDAILSFKGVKHRTEKVCEKDGVNYINDSKATNTASTITAINSITEPVVLILGGSEKGEDYEKLFAHIKSSVVRHVILTGASRINMLKVAGKIGCPDLTVVKNFDDAVRIAKRIAKSGETVLLSPACASFDCFSGYEERGDRFKAIVGEN